MNLRKAYLFNFLSGHGGDFFITLASKCSKVHANAWQDDETFNERMEEFKVTGIMPGNNIGTKLIYKDWQEYQKMIENHLQELRGYAFWKEKEVASFCTHWGQTADIPGLRDSLENYLQAPVEQVNMIPKTEISKLFADHVYKWNVLHDSVPADAVGIDHIDLLLNDRDELYKQVERIGEDVNWKRVEQVIDIYMEYKVQPFLDYYGL